MATLDQTTNSIAVDGNVLLVNTNTNRVGINQSTPSVALHVVGSTTIDSGNLTLSTGDLVITSGAGTIAGQAILKSTDPISLLTNDAGYVTTNTTYSAAAGGGIGLSGTAFSLDIDGMNATSNTPTNDDLLIMDDGANGTNRKITFTQTADWISDNVYRFHIEDLRDEGDISPNNFDDRAMTLLFTDDITGSPNSWDSVITMKGWSANYRVWQLWSSASSGSQSVDQVRLYFRSGEEDVQAGWGQTKEILTFPGTVPVTDGSNGQVMQTNGSGVLSWATISGGGGSGTVTSVATSAPITGGTITGSGTIGIAQSNGGADGYLSSTDWTTFNNKINRNDPVSVLVNDVNYISGNQFVPPVNPPPAGLPDSPPMGQVQAVGWIEFDVGMGPMYLPVYQ